MQDNRTYFICHRTAADTFDKINLHEFQGGAAVLAVFGYALANSTATLPRVTLPLPDWIKEEQQTFWNASTR